jgi:hypothetical protein
MSPPYHSDPITKVVDDPDLKRIAWDLTNCNADEAREYTGSTPDEIDMQRAEWLREQGDAQEEYNIRVRATKEDSAREWDVCVYLEILRLPRMLPGTTACAPEPRGRA